MTTLKLFRLNIFSTLENIFDIVVEAPSYCKLDELLADVDDQGYKLIEIISLLLQEKNILSINIDGEVDIITDEDTIIRWKYIIN